MLDIARNLSVSASVHALTGSSRPGAVPPLVPLVTTPGTSAAAPHASGHPDAEVIDLAGRVQRLAAREDRVVTHTCRIEDAVFVAMRAHPRPELSEPKQRFSSRRSTETDGTRVTTIIEPAGWEAESKTLREAHEAALAVREQQEEQEGARRNLPYWMKLRERTGNRLYRWILQLADMQPTTQAGLAAKAAAVNAIVEDEKLPCDWHQQLATSLSRDVVRLAAPAVPALAADSFEAYHAEIMGLQATIATTEEGAPENEEAWKRWKQVDDRALASRPTTLAGAIGALEYARREHHQFKVEDRLDMQLEVDTTDRLILHLLDGALGVLRGAGSSGVAIPTSEAHIAAMYREAKALDTFALDHATDGQRSDEAIAKALDLKFAAAQEPITTPAAAVAALSWALDEFRSYYVDQPDEPDQMDRWTVTMIEGALGVLRSMAGQSVPSQVDVAPAPLERVEFPHGRYPAGASREDIETYRTFLDRELRYLNWEIYGQTEGRLHLWLDNPAARLHGPSQPPASSRAAAVLTLLGILPTPGVDGRAQAEGLARAAASAA